MTRSSRNHWLGTFQVGEKIIITDPCYSPDIGSILDAEWGEWTARYKKGKDGRICELSAEKDTPGSYELASFKVGVDSGQAGIFDDYYYQDDDVIKGVERTSTKEPICPETPWYSICCDRTLSEAGAGIIPHGCVSSSGYGDGCYDCYIKKNQDGKVCGVKIIFIAEESEEEWQLP